MIAGGGFSGRLPFFSVVTDILSTCLKAINASSSANHTVCNPSQGFQLPFARTVLIVAYSTGLEWKLSGQQFPAVMKNVGD